MFKGLQRMGGGRPGVWGLVCLGAAVAAGLLLARRVIFAQVAVAPPRAGAVTGREVPGLLKIRRLTGLGGPAKVRTPEYRTNVGHSAGLRREWHEVRVSYETTPEWLDELTIGFYVLAARVQGNARLYSFYRLTVTYMDIERGRVHKATAYLRPEAVKRFGEPVGVGVEFSFQGRPVASDSQASIPLPAGAWWGSPLVLESAATTVREGYLINRAQSPFALVDVDGYEYIKR